MLKILYASLRPYYPFRIAHGGQRSLHDLLITAQNTLKADCAALCCSDLDTLPPKEQWDTLGIKKVVESDAYYHIECGYPVYAVQSAKGREHYWQQFERVCKEFQPDLILTGQRGAFEIIQHAYKKGLPAVWNIDTSPGQVGIYEIPDLVEASSMGVTVICCSQYVKERIEILTENKVQPYVVYPPMSREPYQLKEHQPKYLTLINPVEVKGGNLVEPIVESFPLEEFMFVIGWEYPQNDDYWPRFQERMKKYKNVKVVPRVADIRNIFSKTKLLLVPSQWDEALGRVVWEAQCGGIPSVVSATGGLPEVVGEGGEIVQNFTDANAWIKVLKEILSQPERLNKLYTAALKSAERTLFEPDESVSVLMEASIKALQSK